MRLCDDVSQVETRRPAALVRRDRLHPRPPPTQIGFDRTIVFYNDSDQTPLAAARGRLCDVRTGVICSPNNFRYEEGEELEDGAIRITVLANFDRWGARRRAVPPGEAALVRQDRRVRRALHAGLPRSRDRHRHVHAQNHPPLHLARQRRRVRAPRKRLDGRTHLPNVFICAGPIKACRHHRQHHQRHLDRQPPLFVGTTYASDRFRTAPERRHRSFGRPPSEQSLPRQAPSP
jgi:hypothetical protein